jgi:hypothetical protein
VTNRSWPSREEWAANAENHIRTLCLPAERVSSRPADWLADEEMTRMTDLAVSVRAHTRRAINKAARPLQAVLADEPKRAADHLAWIDSLDHERLRQYHHLQHLRSDRARLNAAVRRATYTYATLNDVLFGFSDVVDIAREHAPDAEGISRLSALVGKLIERRDKAAQDALEAAIARERTKRNSDEGWAAEVKRRARIDGGPVIHLEAHP